MCEEVPGKRFRTAHEDFPMPTAVVLKEYRKTGAKYYGAAQLNQRNLFVRDQYTCQYCGRTDMTLSRGEYLTRDHVQPLSRGGEDEWTNVVTSCSTCNHRKDDRGPLEFAKYLTIDRDAEQERYARITSVKEREKTERRLQYLNTCIAAAEELHLHPPKEPVVMDILAKRTRKRQQ